MEVDFTEKISCKVVWSAAASLYATLFSSYVKCVCCRTATHAMKMVKLGGPRLFPNAEYLGNIMSRMFSLNMT